MARKTAQQRIEERLDGPPLGSSQRTEGRKLRLRDVSAVLIDRGLDPIEAICDVLPQLTPSMQAKTLLSLAEFVHPKLARTELTGEGGGPVRVFATPLDEKI